MAGAKRRKQKREAAAVRLSDVAEQAGCSTATVSRVLNRPEGVNRELRLRVDAAVRDLGYLRNSAARALTKRLPIQ